MPLSVSWQQASRTWDIWVAQQAGEAAIAARARQRLAELVEFARTRSPFYRRHYRALPAGCHDPARLPPVNKHELMACFDDWVTDPEARLAGTKDFLADLGLVGCPYLGRYAVFTSSGTTGEPGVFLHDSNALAVYDALLTARFDPAGLAERSMLLGMRRGGVAMVAATGGHFAGVASWERWRRLNPSVAARVFPVSLPLEELVRRLNAFQPRFLAGYPSLMRLLAHEQREGGLKLHLSAAWLGGEELSPAVRAEIEQAFHCRAVEDYGSSEFMNIAFGCSRGRLHVNADWVILEPVDAEYRPLPPGQPSRTVLLTNLANRVQPIIRYDLGDSIQLDPERCACGNPLPVIQVQGRSDETLSFRTADGGIVSILPIPLTTLVEERCGVHRFQLIQTGPARLDVRLETPVGRDLAPTWRRVETGLKAYLASHGLTEVTIRRDPHPPQADEGSGKLRQVWVRTEAD